MAKFDLDYRMRGKSQKIWAFSYSFSVKLTEYETPEIRTWYQITHCDYRGNEIFFLNFNLTSLYT